MDSRLAEAQIAFVFEGENRFQPVVGNSSKWYNWIAIINLRTCPVCRERHRQIRGSLLGWTPLPPVHPNCRCDIVLMKTIRAGTATINGYGGADWTLLNNGKLPGYYISKGAAQKLGWKSMLGNLHIVAPGKQIGGDRFFNDKKRLPDAPGRKWHEADINYKSGYRKTHRVLYSTDGLIFVTYDHYETFFEIN